MRSGGGGGGNSWLGECWQDVRRQEFLVEAWVDLPVGREFQFVR